MMDAAAFWVDIGWKIWTVGLTFYVAFNRQQAESARKFEGFRYDIDGLSDRVTKLETSHLGFDRQLIRIQQSQEGMARDLNGLGGKLGKIETAMAGAPGHKELGEIHEKINGVAENLAHLKGEIKAGLAAQEALLRPIHAKMISHP